MDKNAIKKYAVWARRELIERISQRALKYGINAANVADPNAESVNGHLLSQTEKRQRQALIRSIREKGYEQVMEEAAYTWFNRFAALRFMEVNSYLPSHIRVFTNDAGEFRPQILAEAIHLELDGLDMNKVYELENANKSEELFKYLLIVQCNALNRILPGMFQRIEDYTELLLPDNLLRENSVIERMVTAIPENDWADQVQIIGWLYQYYNTEPKEKVFAALKKNIKISRENIPAATQLFTPDWIVRYMVENSLGHLWLEGHPEAKERLLPTEEERAAYAAGNRDQKDGKWYYYLEEPKQEPEVQAQLAAIRKEYAVLKPEEIRVIDPCMGSGHILCVIFDVLVRIYEDYGYTAREAAVKIVQNNLWGLDIDERAAQLAYFAVMMKAAQYDKRFLRRKDIPQPNVYSPAGYADGKTFGSLITVDELEPIPEKSEEITLFDEDYGEQLNRWNFRHALAQKYHVVVTNPPYMGASNMNAALSEFVKKNYPDSKTDMFAVFIERCGQMIAKNGYQAMITQHAWMFLSSFEKLRAKLQTVDTVNMAHLGARAFEEIGGEVVQTTSFVLRKGHIKDYKGTYCRLIEPTTQQGKEDMFLAGENRYTAQQDNFSKIPGSPVAYWVGEKVFDSFTYGCPIGKLADGKVGLQTGNNEIYLRLWFELRFDTISFNSNPNAKWFPYNKGGGFRRWYGNKEYVLDYENDGQRVKAQKGAFPRNTQYYFHRCITWSDVTTGLLSLRSVEDGYAFDTCAPCLFSDNNSTELLGFLNTKVAQW